ncbi:helix-turn-helix domain-containing protein [Euzebya sp.]|uniref:arsenate reductase/protein-tyrosine-phosphatase family protein n=1 Tax=Euzebya sp. TaxID=1971409 RepID=UPI003517F766
MSGGDLLPDVDDPDRVARARVHAALGDPVRLAIVEALVDSDLAPDEVAAALGVGTNALAHHLNVLERAGVVDRTRSHGDGRRRYLILRGDRLAHLVDARRWRAGSVLFVCTANAARSQMAAALWALRSTVPASSAGRDPATAVADLAVATAARHGLEIQPAAPRGYGAVDESPGLVISVCDRAREADVPFDAPRLHWSVPDPVAAGDAEAFEAAFDVLDRRISQLAPRVVAP